MLLLGFIYRNYKIWNNFPQIASGSIHTSGTDNIGCVRIATEPLALHLGVTILGEQTVGWRQIAGSYSSTAMVNNKMLLT